MLCAWEALGRLFNRGLTGQTTSTVERLMSQGSYGRAFNNALPDLQRVLTPGQLLQAKQVADDIDRAAMSDTIGKVAGSDTMKNMSMANLIGSMTDGLFTKLPGFIQNTVGRPLKWIMEGPEDAVQQQLSQAMENCATAATCRPNWAERAATNLVIKALAMKAYPDDIAHPYRLASKACASLELEGARISRETVAQKLKTALACVTAEARCSLELDWNAADTVLLVLCNTTLTAHLARVVSTAWVRLGEGDTDVMSLHMDDCNVPVSLTGSPLHSLFFVTRTCMWTPRGMLGPRPTSA